MGWLNVLLNLTSSSWQTSVILLMERRSAVWEYKGLSAYGWQP